MNKKMGDIDLDWPNIDADLDKIRASEEARDLIEAPSKQLIKGVAALVTGLGLFLVILLVVVMTPDPTQEIKYTWFFIIEGVTLVIFGYGAYTLDKLYKFLKLCERTTYAFKRT